MLAKTQDRRAKPPLLTYLVAPIISALIAGAASGFMSYVGVQKELSSMTTTVNRVSVAVDRMAENQTNFIETKFFPLALRVEQHNAAINNLSHNIDMLRDDMKTLHPQQRIYSNASSKRQ